MKLTRDKQGRYVITGRATLSQCLQAMFRHEMKQFEVHNRLSKIAADLKNFKDQATSDVEARAALDRAKLFVEAGEHLPANRRSSEVEQHDCPLRPEVRA